MNFNLDIKEILKFFTKISFKIAFFIGIFIYKKYFIDQENEIANKIVNILLTIAIIFLVDSIIDKIISCIKDKKVIHDYKKSIKTLSKPQIELLIAKYFDMEDEEIIINPTAYFDMEAGQFRILQSKGILFQASPIQGGFCFPFSLQDRAYKELEKAVIRKKITYRKQDNRYLVCWYGKNIEFEDIYNNEEYL